MAQSELMTSFLKASETRLEKISEYSGRAIAWLVLVLVLMVCFEAGILRLLLKSGVIREFIEGDLLSLFLSTESITRVYATMTRASTALRELEWHIFGIIFLLGAAYTLKQEGHVRIEIFYQKMSERQRAWVNFLGTLFLLLPFCLTLFVVSIPVVLDVFITGEGSNDVGGLPYRFIIMSAIPLCFLLLSLQGLAMLIRNYLILFDRKT